MGCVVLGFKRYMPGYRNSNKMQCILLIAALRRTIKRLYINFMFARKTNDIAKVSVSSSTNEHSSLRSVNNI